MSAHFEVRGLSHRYGENCVFEDVSFSMKKGEILSLLGASGQGKSTLLLCLAGLERPDSGYIRLGDRVLFSLRSDCPTERRRIGLVFQENSLFPHLTVGDNIAFGMRKGPGDEGEELMGTFGLEGCEHKFPFELSGGQGQRTAMARALASSPEVLLLDEPFVHLDRRLRSRLRRELRCILKRKLVTTVFVSHDREEAFDMGDRVAVLNQGRIEQLDTPYVLYHFPRSRFVASFVGSGLFLPGKMMQDGDGRARTPVGDILVKNTLLSGEVEIYLPAGGIKLSRHQARPYLKGKVLRKYFRGEGFRYDVAPLDGDQIFENLLCRENFSPGEDIFISVREGVTGMAFYSER